MSQDREIFARKKYFVFPSKIGTFDILKDKDNFLLFYLLIFFFFFFFSATILLCNFQWNCRCIKGNEPWPLYIGNGIKEN